MKTQDVTPNDAPNDLWSVAETLSGKKILVTGSTGFLAKVLVSMILRYHADIDQLYVVIRSRRTASASARFRTELIENGTFDPLHEIYGDGLDAFLEDKVTVIAGDITSPNLGMSEEDALALSSELDVFINSAGLTNFNPNLEHALTINTLSERNIAGFIELGGYHAKLVHVSTSFVAGNTTTPTPEVAPEPHIYPAREELGADFDVYREVDDCLAMIKHAKVLTLDQERASLLAKQARDELSKRNLDPDDDHHFSKEYADQETKWIRRHLSDRGRERAAHWGFPNIYTYTKSMGERLLMGMSDKIDFSIVRPAVIESAVAYPLKGWNEGINTSAPLIYLRYKGHQYYPARKTNSLDVIPVDYVCGAMLAVAAGLIQGEAEEVYNLGSSDLNPLNFDRLVELTTLGVRKIRKNEVKTPTWEKVARGMFEGRVVSERTFNKRSGPGLNKAIKGARRFIAKLPTKQLGGLGKALVEVDKGAKVLESATNTTAKMFEIFMPFIYHNKFTFRARAIGRLRERLVEHERDFYGSPIEDLCWRTYWIDVHVPGLYKFVFPHLEEKLSTSQKSRYTYRDLMEVFDASTSNFPQRVAFQHHHRGQIIERYTYAELRERAERAALMLGALGVGKSVPALLVSENRPQWGMSYFGVLKAGGVAVPVDPESNPEKVARLAEACGARVIIISDEVRARIGAEVEAIIAQKSLPTRLVTFNQLFTLQLTAQELSEDEATPTVSAGALTEDGIASLIFTSGTTGDPKGVMLTHENFTSLLASMAQVFKISHRDGFLSVLPLHHTFEFSCGFLMPLSRGATITYLEELNGEELTSAMTSTRVTAMVGVPALWQLLNRRVQQRLDDLPDSIRWTIRQLISMNKSLRRRFGLNLGPAVFGVVHRAFGGKMRYFVSGGAALPGDVLTDFYGLGFNMYEGYGLTEAAPVLTVNSPNRGLNPGSVGRPLPGVEVDVIDMDDRGVGQVVARGDNVMRGYLNKPEETERALKDGWLHTGDLGQIDAKGNLTIVGRAKEVIVTAGGKNVYPDELEEMYGSGSLIEELSIVGLPDGQGSERVAALVRTTAEESLSDEERADVRARVREWFRVEGSRAAPHERIQVLRFWEDELPRTATRKIKRKEVIQILDRLMRAEAKARTGEDKDDGWNWLDRIIGTLCDMDPSHLHPTMHFQDDLAFDSLMVVELNSILETKGYHLPPGTLATAETLQELRDMLEGGSGATSGALVRTNKGTLSRVDEYDVPDPISRWGKGMLHRAQIGSYANLFNVKVYGRANIPHHNPNVIVIANHCSHLDMGLVKYALGEYGSTIRAVAAADYFFKNPVRKTYFKNFTNLVPIERSGTLESSLVHAVDALQRGEMLLIFPEGTRSKDGKLQEFRRGLGYLVATQKVDILPVWIEGTHRAFPKGAKLPSPTSRNLKVFIGQPLDADVMLEESKDMGVTDRYKHISASAQRAVEALRDRDVAREKKRGLDLSDLFNDLQHRFSVDAIDTPLCFYFSLGKLDESKWTVMVDSKSCSVHMGKPPAGKADCVVKTTPDIFRKIVEEAYAPSVEEFMTGAIKTNALELLQQFPSAFQLGASRD